MSRDSWLGDIIFDPKQDVQQCVKSYDEHLLRLFRDMSGNTVEALPNLKPLGVDVNLCGKESRCSVQIVKDTHFLECIHSDNFYPESHTNHREKHISGDGQKRKFLIIGAGPAGNYMAIQCLLRGHIVTLVELRKGYRRSIPCAFFHDDLDFFRTLGIPRSIFVKPPAEYSKKYSLSLADIEEIFLKIALKLGAYTYMGCTYDWEHDEVISVNGNGIRLWDGVEINRERVEFDTIVNCTGDMTQLPRELFKLGPARKFSSIVKEYKSYDYSNPSDFFLHTDDGMETLIASRISADPEDLKTFMSLPRYDKYDEVFAFVSNFDPAIFHDPWLVSKRTALLPNNWIINTDYHCDKDTIEQVQFEGPFPHMPDLKIDLTTNPYRFVKHLLEEMLDLELNQDQWMHYVNKDSAYPEYFQRKVRVFKTQFRSMIQPGYLKIKSGRLDYEHSHPSMVGVFKRDIDETEKEYLIIGDSLQVPFYRFGNGYNNATLEIRAYFEGRNAMLDCELSLIKQAVLVLFSVYRSSKINEKNELLVNLIRENVVLNDK